MYKQISIKSAGKGEAVVCTEGQEIAVQGKGNFTTGDFSNFLRFKMFFFPDSTWFSNGVEPTETNYRHP